MQEEDPLTDVNYNACNVKSLENTKDETFKFTLSLETCDKQSKPQVEDTLKLSLSPIKEKSVVNDNAEDDLLLRDIAMNQTNSSFLNFQNSKHLGTYVDKKIENREENVLKDALTGNDTIFLELCDKYLNKATKCKTDFEKNFSQPQCFSLDSNTFKDSLLQQRSDFKKSLTQFPLPRIQSPQQNTIMNANDLTMDFEMTMEKNLRRKSASFTVKTPKKPALDSKTMLSKSYSFNLEEDIPNVDLTQQLDEDTVEDDDGLILSDDEINYSIWQANKTANLPTSEQFDMENEIISISDVDSSDEENNEFLLESPKKVTVTTSKEQSIDGFSTNGLEGFSFSDFENQCTSIEKSPNLVIASDCETEMLVNKHDTSRIQIRDDFKFDRSEFGILEEYSEPIDYSPRLSTPTKVLTEASFLNSPTEQSLAMKRFSNCQESSNKFKELLDSLNTKSPPPYPSLDTINDFDEFDQLVYMSSLKTKEDSVKKPQGIEKLLTAEISFNEEVPATETRASSTILSNELQEIKCNNKTYLLRYDYTHKPDYAQLSEPELLKQLYNFGIKPLKRKHAVKMLEYIYNQTHPVLIEDSVETSQNIAGKNQETNAEKYDKEFDKPCTSNSILESKIWSSEKGFNMENSAKEATNSTQAINTKFKLNLKDSCGQDMLLYSNVLKAEMCNENYILQTNVTKKVSCFL